MNPLIKTILSGIACCAILTGCQPREPEMSPQTIKILTYNIFHGEKYYTPGENNLQEIAQVINDLQPDVVALQEVDRLTTRSARLNGGERKDLMQELARMTGMHGYFGHAMVQHDGGYGEGILSRTPKQPTVHILPTPQGGEPRALISIEHTFPDGRSVVFSGTHLCHEFEGNRIAQVEAIVDILKASGKPALVAGDFNFTPDQAPYAVIRASMRDSGEVFGETSNTWTYHERNHRLDYVFMDNASPWQVKEVRLIDTNASDHLPVFVVLELAR